MNLIIPIIAITSEPASSPSLASASASSPSPRAPSPKCTPTASAHLTLPATLCPVLEDTVLCWEPVRSAPCSKSCYHSSRRESFSACSPPSLRARPSCSSASTSSRVVSRTGWEEAAAPPRACVPAPEHHMLCLGARPSFLA